MSMQIPIDIVEVTLNRWGQYKYIYIYGHKSDS